MLKARITATLETSEHDGYCSGEECEYNVRTITYDMVAPIEYKSYPEGKLSNLDEYDIDWIDLLPEPVLNDGSCYCSLPKECIDHDLSKHDYRYTILYVELFRPTEKK